MSRADCDPLATLVTQAVAGDAGALEELCAELQQPIYRLALRFFSDPHDAADATQEALILVITHLGSFQHKSKVSTWAHTVASRQFLRMKTTRVEQSVAGPREFGEWIDTHRALPSAEEEADLEFQELAGDVRIACTYGMLLCLSRPVRIAYLLGDVIGLSDVEGAEACGIKPAAFRQRLSRARRTMRSILANRCGLIDANNPCRCTHLVAGSIETGLLNPTKPNYAGRPGTQGPIPHSPIAPEVAAAAAKELDAAVALGEVFRTDPTWRAPVHVMENINKAMPTLVSSTPKGGRT